MIFQGFRRKNGPAKASLFSAVFFGLAHLHPLLYLPIAVLGFILGWVFEWRNSIFPGMVAHALFNTVGFIGIVHALR